ncbi:MAG TPA: VanZ family protein [Gemmatimonadaceae bacterium]|nr:VanZ family protein [Gemmatimonadaceae bacterium]
MTEARAGARLTVVALVVIALLTLVPSRAPFSTFALCVLCGDRGTTDALLNVLLFLPFGVGMRLRGEPLGRTVRVALVISAGIELLQLTTITGRTSSPGDILTNTAGAALGAVLARHWRAIILPSGTQALRLGIAGGLAWLGILVLTGVAMQPRLTHEPLYAQIRPAIPTEARRYPGGVGNVTSNGVALRPGLIADSARRASMLDREAGELSALIEHPPATARSIIARIVDERRRTRLELRQSGSSLQFEPSLRAATLRLTSPSVRIGGAFPARCAADRMRATGSLRSGVLRLTLGAPPCAARSEARLRVSTGWVLLAPFAYAFGPEAPWLSTLWLGVLVFVWSYWLGAYRGARRSALLRVAGAVIVAVGLGVVPWVAALPASTPWEWLVAFAALLGGLASGARRAAGDQREPAPDAARRPTTSLAARSGSQGDPTSSRA